jgi:cyclopropane fatty-acyl-phospholipid synthase-like methyltransferase
MLKTGIIAGMNPSLFSPASDRNRHPILEQLGKHLRAGDKVLEIGSGWAQHAKYFVSELPGIRWLPSERLEALPELRACLADSPSERLLAPITLDVSPGPWPDCSFNAVYSANTAHIMSWPEVQDMFRGIESCLATGGVFVLYGPFNRKGEFTSPSNRQFDVSLKSRNPAMGIRDLEALEKLASDHQMDMEECTAMPANNMLLVFRKAMD